MPLGTQAPSAGVSSTAHVVILAGGEGTRLWPLSRRRRPKQLLRLTGDRSLVRLTVDRVLPLVPPERILVVTERTHADALREDLPDLPAANIVVEPIRRNTAPALLLAALHLRPRAPEATWASLHSDAFIPDEDEFRRTLRAAIEVAAAGTHLVTTGIRPQYPATGYGYIQQGDKLGEVQGYPVYSVRRFVEKPGLATAQTYVLSGDYLWNPGVFAWKNTTLLDAFRSTQPETYGLLASTPLEQIAEVYPRVPKQPIDTAIMERADNVATIPATFRWSDVGSWSELWEVSEKDGNGNLARGRGRHLAVDTSGTIVYAEGRVVATVGIRELVVIETADAVFSCPRDRAQDSKLVVSRLQAEGVTGLL
jgi:mannose-1-phosphate guanylyltransferase